MNSPSAPPLFNDSKRCPPLSFSGSGWLMTYEFGCAQALQDVGLLKSTPRTDGNGAKSEAWKKLTKEQVATAFNPKPAVPDLDTTPNLYGSSGGSVCAGIASLQIPMSIMRDYTAIRAEEARSSFWNLFKLREYVLWGVRNICSQVLDNEQQFFQVLNERVHMYATTLPFLSVFLLKLGPDPNLGRLEENVAASCCFTPFAGFPFPLSYSPFCWVMDGGVSNLIPKSGGSGDEKEKVVTVSVFTLLLADINPSKDIPAYWCAFPPSGDKLVGCFDLGYNDTLDYLVGRKLVEISWLDKKKKLPDWLEKTQNNNGILAIIIQAFTQRLTVYGIKYLLRPLLAVVLLIYICFWWTLAVVLVLLHDAFEFLKLLLTLIFKTNRKNTLQLLASKVYDTVTHVKSTSKRQEILRKVSPTFRFFTPRANNTSNDSSAKKSA